MFHIVGFEPGEVVPTLELLVRHADPAHRDRLIHVLGESATSGEAFSCRFRLLDAGRRRRTVVVVGEHTDSAGQGRALRGFLVEVTDGLARDTTAACDAAIAGVMEHRAVIEQAKGALMIACGVDDESAFGLLRTTSQNHNVKVHALAEAFTAACAARPADSSLTAAAAVALLIHVAATAGTSVA